MSSQAIMYIILGFAFASLIAIILSKIIYIRAYKAATKQFRGQIPLNKAELEAERDRLRSEHAVNVTKLEHKIAASLQSELQYRIKLSKNQEQMLQTDKMLNNYIKKAIRWEAAHDNGQEILKLTTNKLDIQTKKVDEMLEQVAQVELMEKRHNDARLTYELADAKYLKVRNDRDETNREIKNIKWELDKIQSDHEITKAKLKEALHLNVGYEGKIAELSTESLFLGQQLHAKKIKLDMSTNAIDRYKEKLLKQKLLNRDSHRGKKAITALKHKIVKNTLNKTEEKPDNQLTDAINADLIKTPAKTSNLFASTIKLDNILDNKGNIAAIKVGNVQEITPTPSATTSLKDRMRAVK